MLSADTFFNPIVDYPVNRWHASSNVNFNGMFYMSQLGLADMVPKNGGTAIVNISSAAGIGPGRGPYPPGSGGGGGTLYGMQKAAMERFTQGLAAEVYENGVSVSCYSPSLVVPTPGVVHHKLIQSEEQPVEWESTMAHAALLLASEPLDKTTGRVTYSQCVLTLGPCLAPAAMDLILECWEQGDPEGVRLGCDGGGQEGDQPRALRGDGDRC